MGQKKTEDSCYFLDIKKAYNKINRKKTFKQLENMGIQRQMHQRTD